MESRDVSFVHHAKKNDLTGVLVSKLTMGISNDEIRFALDYYGDILSVQQVTKVMFGKKLDTGDRVVLFKEIHKDIPSYVPVRGWKAYIMYTGQPKTCRSCGKVGHFAKNCSSKRKPDETFSEDQNIPGKKRKSNEKSTGDQDIPVNMEITELSVIPTHEQVIKELMDTLAEIGPDPVEPVQGNMKESQSVKKDSPDIDKSCSSQSSMNSPSDAEGSAALPKQSTEGNLAAGDDKQGNSSQISGVKPLGAKDSMKGATGVGKKKKKKKRDYFYGECGNPWAQY